MRTNSLLTYLLYALLIGLIAAAGFKACQMKKEKQLMQAKQEAELQQTLRDMGYKSEDTTGTSSSYIAGSETDEGTTGGTPSTSTNNGIEDEPQPSKPTSSPATVNKEPITTTVVKTTPKGAENSAVKSAAVRNLDNDTRSRYRVQVGSFSKMEGARRQLEAVIKMGYQNAEIGKTNNGKYAVVVVMRTNDKSAALREVDKKLESRGVDAAVMDNRKN